MRRAPSPLSIEGDTDPEQGPLETVCLIWKWSRYPNGYGSFRQGMAHRAFYEAFVGPIPGGLVIDHLCDNPPCVNPVHLRVVTQRENVLRGNGLSAQNARKTHCVRGHELPEARPGGRTCLACAKVLRDRHWNKKRAEAGLPPRERFAPNATKTTCNHGHEFTAANTFIDRQGRRRCRRCGYEGWKARQERLFYGD